MFGVVECALLDAVEQAMFDVKNSCENSDTTSDEVVGNEVTKLLLSSFVAEEDPCHSEKRFNQEEEEERRKTAQALLSSAVYAFQICNDIEFVKAIIMTNIEQPCSRTYSDAVCKLLQDVIGSELRGDEAVEFICSKLFEIENDCKRGKRKKTEEIKEKALKRIESSINPFNLMNTFTNYTDDYIDNTKYLTNYAESGQVSDSRNRIELPSIISGKSVESASEISHFTSGIERSETDILAKKLLSSAEYASNLVGDMAFVRDIVVKNIPKLCSLQYSDAVCDLIQGVIVSQLRGDLAVEFISSELSRLEKEILQDDSRVSELTKISNVVVKEEKEVREGLDETHDTVEESPIKCERAATSEYINDATMDISLNMRKKRSSFRSGGFFSKGWKGKHSKSEDRGQELQGRRMQNKVLRKMRKQVQKQTKKKLTEICAE